MPRLITLVVLAMFAVGCAKHIGDACLTNLDCQQDQSRECDLSQPGGYCTIFSCDEKSCPGGSVCIRSYSTYVFATTTCQTDKDCTADYICLPDYPTSLCVRRSDELRFCADSCGSDGDCRGGYVCQTAGSITTPATAPTRGSLALVNTAKTTQPVRFCAPE